MTMPNDETIITEPEIQAPPDDSLDKETSDKAAAIFRGDSASVLGPASNVLKAIPERHVNQSHFIERKQIYHEWLDALDNKQDLDEPRQRKKINEAEHKLKENTDSIKLQGKVNAGYSDEDINNILSQVDQSFRMSYYDDRALKRKEVHDLETKRALRPKFSESPEMKDLLNPDRPIEGIGIPYLKLQKDIITRDFKDDVEDIQKFGITPATIGKISGSPLSNTLSRNINTIAAIPYLLAGKLKQEDIPKIIAGETSVMNQVEINEMTPKVDDKLQNTKIVDTGKLNLKPLIEGMGAQPVISDKIAAKAIDTNLKNLSLTQQMAFAPEAFPVEALDMALSWEYGYGPLLFRASKIASKLPLLVNVAKNMGNPVLEMLPKEEEMFGKAEQVGKEAISKEDFLKLAKGRISKLQDALKKTSGKFIDALDSQDKYEQKIAPLVSKELETQLSKVKLEEMPTDSTTKRTFKTGQTVGDSIEYKKMTPEMKQAVDLRFKKQWLLNEAAKLQGKNKAVDQALWHSLNRNEHKLQKIYTAEIPESQIPFPNRFEAEANEHLYNHTRLIAKITGEDMNTPEMKKIFKQLSISDIKKIKREPVWKHTEWVGYDSGALGIDDRPKAVRTRTNEGKSWEAQMWDKYVYNPTHKVVTPIAKYFVDKFNPAGIMKTIIDGGLSAEERMKLDPESLKTFLMGMMNTGAKQHFIDFHMRDFYENVKSLSGQAQQNLGYLLDNFATSDKIPGSLSKVAGPEVLSDHDFLRHKTDLIAALEHARDKNKLGPGQKVSAYWTRSQGIDGTHEELKMQRQSLINLIDSGRATPEDKADLKFVNNAISRMETPGVTMTPKTTPKFLGGNQFKERTLKNRLVKEYNIALEYEHRLRQAARFLYDEPVIQYGLKNMEKIKNPVAKAYTQYWLARYHGVQRDDPLRAVMTAIGQFEYEVGLGWNAKSGFIHALKNLNTLAELGPDWTQRAAAGAVTRGPLFKSWLSGSNLMPVFDNYRNFIEASEFNKPLAETAGAKAVPQDFKAIPKVMEGALNSGFFLMNKVEMANRTVAGYGAFLKYMDEGINNTDMKSLMRKGSSKLEAARYLSDLSMAKTQFVFGKVGASRAFYSTAGRALMPFTSFPLKELELFNKWAHENPLKLFSYCMVANALNNKLHHYGLDAAHGMGIGIDSDMVMDAMHDLGTGNLDIGRQKLQASVDPNVVGAGVADTTIGGLDILNSTRKTLIDGKGWAKMDAFVPAAFKRYAQDYMAFKEGPLTGPRIDIKQNIAGQDEKEMIKNYVGYGLHVASLNDANRKPLNALLNQWELMGRTFMTQTKIERDTARIAGVNKIYANTEKGLTDNITEEMKHFVLDEVNARKAGIQNKNRDVSINNVKGYLIRLASLPNRKWSDMQLRKWIRSWYVSKNFDVEMGNKLNDLHEVIMSGENPDIGAGEMSNKLLEEQIEARK